MNKTRVSEIITTDEIKKWSRNENIIVKAGTGLGKSYFIKNLLYAFAESKNKKILMLVHRSNCLKQFQDEIIEDNKQDIIHIKTYQKLDFMELKKYYIDLSEYEYIVCDEWHHFISDASFSISTDLSFNLILAQKNAVKIFMSATGDYCRDYLKTVKNINPKEYELPIEYTFIDSLTFFNKDETMEQFIKENIESDEFKDHKAIFFIQSAEKAYSLYKKYKEHCIFNCSKNNTKYYKYVDEEKINNILLNESFEEKILITTTCMDAGVNLIDKQIKHIVCDVEDTGTLIQCIGRRRIDYADDNDKIYVYIKTINNQQLGGKETQLKRKIEKADYLKEHTVQEYILKYPRSLDYSNIIYDDPVTEEDKCTKRINELMYYKCKCDISEINTIKTFGKFAYTKYIAKMLGFENNYRLIEEDYMKSELEEYLESIIGKKLFKEEQKELIDRIGLKVDGKVQKSYFKLNEGLKMINLNYIILPKKSNNKRYWIIEKIEE